MTHDQYLTDGYAVVPLFQSDVLDPLRQDIRDCLSAKAVLPPGVRLIRGDGIITRANQGGIVYVTDPILFSQRWRDLAADPKIIELLLPVLGPDFDLFMTFARVRVPGHRGNEGWHRDLGTDRLDRPELVTVILYLDDFARESGATQVVAGSHRDGWDPVVQAARECEVPTASRVRHLEGPAGSVALLDGLTVHCAGFNSTGRTGAAIFMVYRSAAATLQTAANYAMSGTPIARSGRVWPISQESQSKRPSQRDSNAARQAETPGSSGQRG